MNLQEIRDKLDEVGCGFCLAKWTQVTMHLGIGMTHSCHHPSPHKIPLQELETSHTALHNTTLKKRARKEMITGKRPKECNYCWKVEDNSNSFSDRVFKSSEPWSFDQYEVIRNLHPREDYNPRYVEVSFSNTCNFKCVYCSPQFSSKWVEEIEKLGGYPTTTNYNNIDDMRQKDEMPYKKSDYNPYVDAFWKWWPDLYKDLHTFRITGGEPLLSKDTFKVLDYIRENWKKNPNLSLAINSNLGAPDKLIEQFIKSAKDICDNNKVKEFIIFTSIEAEGQQADYTRYGLDSQKFWKNIDKILSELPKVTINIMATFNALSVFTYDHLIERVFRYKKKYSNGKRYSYSAIQLDTSYLRWPPHLSVKILNSEQKKLILNSSKKMLYYGIKDFDQHNYGFSNIEIQKLKRIYDYSISEDSFDLELNRCNFVKFVDELDLRRGTNFLNTFPELKEIYDTYK